MMNNELKQLRRHRTCTRIALVWSCGWLMASCLMLADLAKGQAIYLNHDYGAVDPVIVDKAAWSIRQRADMAIGIAGTSTTACGNPITVRYAGIAEWAAINAPAGAYAVTANCPTSPQKQVVWSPYSAMNVNGLRHELSHAAGCSQHLFSTDNVMHAAGSAEFLTASDVDCIINSAFWPLGTVDRCFVEVGAAFDMYIPSVSGLQVWLGYQGIVGGQHTWTETRRRVTGLGCPGNALSGSAVTFDDVRGYGMPALAYARLRHLGGVTWILEAAR